MQLALLIPFFVIIYKKSAIIGHLVSLIVQVVIALGIAYVCAKYDLKAGPLADENWYLFSYMFQKPWFKINSMMVGVTAAYMYMQILQFRKIPDAAARKKEFPCLNFLHHSTLMHFLFVTIGMACILFGLLSGHDAIVNADKWSQPLNVAYYTVERPVYVFGMYLILFTFFTGGFTFGKTFLTRPFFLVLGKLTFITALITPMMIQLIYSTMDRGLFVSFNRVLELGVGNMITILVAALLLHFLFEFPLKRLFQITLYRFVSHDKVLFEGKKANGVMVSEPGFSETHESQQKFALQERGHDMSSDSDGLFNPRLRSETSSDRAFTVGRPFTKTGYQDNDADKMFKED